MNGYESARILNPMEAQKMSVQDIEAHIDVLNETFPFINDEFVTGSINVHNCCIVVSVCILCLLFIVILIDLKNEIKSYLSESKATKSLPPIDKNDTDAPKLKKRGSDRRAGTEGEQERESFSRGQ